MTNLNVIDLVDGNAWEAGGDGYIIKAGQGQVEYRWRDLVARAEMAYAPWGLFWLCDARYSPESHKAAIKAAFPTGNFGKLGLWLDVEKPRLDMKDAEYMKLPYAYYKPIESIWRGLQAYTGVYPGWYFGPSSWDLICGAMPLALQQEIASKCECWIGHYTSAAQPSMRGEWVRWAMWQWREGPDYSRVNADWWAQILNAAPPIPEPGGNMYQGIVNVASLRIRSGPGTEYQIVGSLPNGMPVEASEKSAQWWHLTKIHGLTVVGEQWASGDYIQETAAPPATELPTSIEAKLYDDAGNILYSGILAKQ